MNLDKQTIKEIEQVVEARVKNKAIDQAINELFDSRQEEDQVVVSAINREKTMLKEKMREFVVNKFGK